MICYENVNIYEVNKREGEYNDKKKKYIKFAKPKITKKLVFEDCYSSLEELSNEIRHLLVRFSAMRDALIAFIAPIAFRSIHGT